MMSSTYKDGTMWRPLGLKMFDSTKFILGLGDDTSMSGRRAYYDYVSGDWTFFAGDQSGNAHDIVAGYESDTFWQPTLVE